MRARTFLARAENAMEKTPLRLLVVLRFCPLVPFNLLNYYVGATYRFTLWHNLASLLFVFPGCVVWAGIGAGTADCGLEPSTSRPAHPATHAPEHGPIIEQPGTSSTLSRGATPSRASTSPASGRASG